MGKKENVAVSSALGEINAFLGEGSTVEEALANLEKTKRYLFQKYLEQGIPIPV